VHGDWLVLLWLAQHPLLVVRAFCVSCWFSCSLCMLVALWVVCHRYLGWYSGLFPFGGFGSDHISLMLSQDLPADPKLLPACIWVVDVRGFTVSNPTLYTLMVSIGVIHYDCSVGYMGAFVPVAYASPCPSFNRGKIAPGGGRGSRSPQAGPSRMTSTELGGGRMALPVVDSQCTPSPQRCPPRNI